MREKALKEVTVSALFAMLAFSATCAEPASSRTTSSGTSAAELSSRLQMRQSRIDAAIAPIKSKQDLQVYLATAKPGTSPLDALSFAAKQRFLASLRFNEKGITSFEYADLQNELTPIQVYKVLALFGAQRDTAIVNAPPMTKTDWVVMGGPGGGTVGLPPPGDHDGYQCESRGTCRESPSAICTSTC
jgi:hypothetical protein